MLVISNKVDPIASIHIAKRGWKYGAQAGVLKRRGLALFLSNFFKVYHFFIQNYFKLCKIVLRI